MKAIVLAAGFATRLYPVTLTQPKPLLKVAGRPLIEHVLERLGEIESLDQIIVVTNDKFAARFEGWLAGYHNLRIAGICTVLNDGATDDSNKLGAIGDLLFTLREAGLDDDLVVVAGDNLFSHGLKEFGEYCEKINAPVLALYDVGALDQVKKYSAISVGHDGRINAFEEKPQHPMSTLTGIALYFYPRASLPMIRRYAEEGNNQDQPGRLMEWLYQRAPVYTWNVPGIWYDIGAKETLEEANRIFADSEG